MKFISTFNRQFERLHERNCAFVSLVPADKIYWQPRVNANGLPVYSCGEYVLRSAGKVEQTFGGITAKLWDDPFEWTLPEELSDNAKILEYLAEVENTRQRGLALLATDADLTKEILAPDKLKTIFELLLETLAQAENFQGRAFATFRLFSDAPLPG